MTRAAGKRPRRGSRSRRPRAVRTRRLERVDPRTDDLRSADPPYPDADPHRHSGAGRRLGRRRWSTRRKLRRAVAGPEMDRSQGGTYGWPVAARPRWRKLRAARLAPPERRTGIRLVNRWPSTYRGWTACFLSSAVGLRLPRSGPAGYFHPQVTCPRRAYRQMARRHAGGPFLPQNWWRWGGAAPPVRKPVHVRFYRLVPRFESRCGRLPRTGCGRGQSDCVADAPQTARRRPSPLS